MLLHSRRDSMFTDRSAPLRISWYHPALRLQQGDEITASVKIKPLHGVMNVGSFNYQRWLWSQRVSGTAYIKQLDERKKNTSVRAELFEHLQSAFTEQKFNQSAPMLALLFAYKDFDEHLWSTLRQFGLSHLFAISGLHIGLAAGFTYLLMSGLCRLFIFLYFTVFFTKGSGINTAKRYINHPNNFKILARQTKHRQLALHVQCYAPLLVSLISACLYAALAGFAITTLRAVIALVLLYSIRIFELGISRGQLFLLCIVCLLLISPLAMLSSGFWLSIVAVAVIIFSFWRFDSSAKVPDNSVTKRSIITSIGLWAMSLLRLQLLFLIIMLPLQIYFFSGMSYLAPFANLIAIPLFSFVVVPLLLFALLLEVMGIGFSMDLFSLVNEVLDWFWQLLTLVPGNSGWFDIDPNTALLFAIAVCILLLLQLPMNFRSWILALCLAMGIIIFTYSDKKTETQWRASILDVGQGLAVVIEQRDHRLIYDVGAQYRSGFSWAQRVVIPYLQNSTLGRKQENQSVNDKRQIDYLIISHSDNDHSGGLKHILNQFEVTQFISGEHEITGGRECIANKRQWGDLSLQFIPGKSLSNDGSKVNNNNRSCSLLVSDGKLSLLLTGDIEMKQERDLIITHGEHLQADVIVAPHHGSKSSSSAAFLDVVKPKINVFSSGFNNRWGFPAQEVLKRYQNRGVVNYNTAEEGVVIIDFKEEINVTTYRQNIAPYWYNQTLVWPGWW